MQGLKGKEIFFKLGDEAGGFEGERSRNDISISLDQIYDISRKSKNETDELLEILDIAASQRNSPNAFVWDVPYGDDFSTFLASNQELQNIKRFCLDSCWSILGVDPTFNICDYNVTVTTYKHPLLVDKTTNHHPVMIGPSIIHSNKTFESYFSLSSNIVRLEPSLQNFKVFRIDGEVNVYRSMQASISNAEHLLCFIHAKDNIVKKCASLGIERKIYISEIFGVKVGETKIKGLLDCTSKKDFEKQYQKLKKILETRPNGDKFVSYIERNKIQHFRDNMLAKVREKCGLGSPPKVNNQNANEAINSLIKRAKGPGKLTLKETIQLLQKEVRGQEENAKLALLGKGKISLSNSI